MKATGWTSSWSVRVRADRRCSTAGHQVESKPEWPRADCFKVHAEDGRDYLLKHDLESDDWGLGRSW